MSNQSPGLFEGPMYNPPDMSRAWAIANQSLPPDEQGDVVAKLAGAVMGGHDLGKMLVDRFNSGERDEVVPLNRTP